SQWPGFSFAQNSPWEPQTRLLICNGTALLLPCAALASPSTSAPHLQPPHSYARGPRRKGGAGGVANATGLDWEISFFFDFQMFVKIESKFWSRSANLRFSGNFP